MLRQRSAADAHAIAERNVQHIVGRLLPELLLEGLIPTGSENVIYMTSSHLVSPGVTWQEFCGELAKSPRQRDGKQLEEWYRNMVIAENDVIEMFEQGGSLTAIKHHVQTNGLGEVIALTTNIEELRIALKRAHVIQGTYTDFNPYEIPVGILMHCCIEYASA